METISETSHQHNTISVEASSCNRVARTSTANFHTSNRAGDAGFLQTSVDYEINSMEPITNPDQQCTSGSSSSSSYLEWEHCSNVMQQLQQQQQQLRYCDVVFHVHGATFQAHRCVLAACSTYLASVFRKKQAVRDTIRLANFPDGAPSASTFQQLLLFAYTGAVLLPGVAAAEELLHLADYLQVPHLLNLCSRYLHQQLSSSNCLKVIELAQRYRLSELDAAASALLRANLATVLTGSEVLGLGQQQLEQLILAQCRDRVATLTGEAMLACIMRWLVRQALLVGRSPDGVPVPSSPSHPTDVAPALLTLVPWRHVSVRFAEALLQTSVRCLGASHRLVSVLAHCCLQHHLLPRHLHCLLQEEAEESAVDMAAFNDLAIRTAIQNYQLPIKEKHGVSLEMTRRRAPSLDEQTHPQTLRQNHLADGKGVTLAVEESESDREKQSSTDCFSVSLEAKCSEALKSLLDCFQQHARNEDKARDLLMSPSPNCDGYLDNGTACLNTETSGMARTIIRPKSGEKFRNAISSENPVKETHFLQEKAISYISKSVEVKEESSRRCLPLPSMHSFGERFSQFTAENNDSCQDMAGHVHQNGSRREFRLVPSRCIEDEGNSGPRFIEHHHKREQQHQHHHQLHHLGGDFQDGNPNPGVGRFESSPDVTNSSYRATLGTNTSEFSHVEADEFRTSERPRQGLEQKMSSSSSTCANHHQQQNLSCEAASCCSYMPPLKRSKVDVYHDSSLPYGETAASSQQNEECSSTNEQSLSYDPTQIYAPCYGHESFIPEESSDTNLVETHVKPVPSPVVDTASSETRSQFFVSPNTEESHANGMRFNHVFAMFGKEPQDSESPRQEAVFGSGVMLSPVTSNTGDTFEDTCTSYFPQDMTVRKQVQPLLQGGDGAPGHLQRVNKDISSSQTTSCSQSSRPTGDLRKNMQFRNPSIASSIEISTGFRSKEDYNFHEKPYLVNSTRCPSQRKEHVQLHQSDSNLVEHFSADFIRQSPDKNNSADSQTFTDEPRRHRLADVYSDHCDHNNKRLLPSVDVVASRQKLIKKTDHRERYSKHLWLKRVPASEETNQCASHVMDSKYNGSEHSSYAISIKRAIGGNQMVSSVHSAVNENLQAEDRSITQEASKTVFFGRTVECSDPTPAALWASSPSKGTHDERDARVLNNPERDLDQNTYFEGRKSIAKECFNNSSSWLHAEDLLTTPEKMLCNTGLQNKSFLSLTSPEFEKEGCAVVAAAVEEAWHGLVDGAAVTAHFCGHEEGSANSICTDAPSRSDQCISTSAQNVECYKKSEENAFGLGDKSANHEERRKEERWYNRDLLVPARDVVVSPTIKRDHSDDSRSLAYKNASGLSGEESSVRCDGADNPYSENTLQILKFKMYKTRRSLTEECASGTAHAASQRPLSNIHSKGKFESETYSPSHETELAKKLNPSVLCASQVGNINTLDTSIKRELPPQAVNILSSNESGRCFKQSLAKYRLRPQAEPVVSSGVSPSVSTSGFNCTDDLLWDQDEDRDDPITGVEVEDVEADGEVALNAMANDPIRRDQVRDVGDEVSQVMDGADAEAVIALSSYNHICDNDVPASISSGDALLPHSQNDLPSTHTEKDFNSTLKGSIALPTHSSCSVPSESEGVVLKCKSISIKSHMKKYVAADSKDMVINECAASATFYSDVHPDDSLTALSSTIVAHDDALNHASSTKDNNYKTSLKSNNATVETLLQKSISNKKELQSPLEVPGKRIKLKRSENFQSNNQERNLSAGDLKTTCRPIQTRALSEEFEAHCTGSESVPSISEATADVPKSKRKPKARNHPLRRQEKRSCDICDHEFVGRLFFKHMVEHFPGPKHSCDTCERVFERIYHLLEHRLTHKDVKPHCCPHCPFSTTKRDNLRVHVLSHDDPHQLPFKCPHCERRFARRQLLEHHVTSHSDAKTQRCDLCAYTAKTKNQLALHKRTHTGAVYTCQFGTCAYSTSKKSHFTDHLLTHSERRFFSCSKCGSQYRTKTHLLRHQVSHLPQKPFACDQCDYSANRADRLKAHKKKMHSPPDASTNASLRRRRQQLKKRDGAQGLPAMADTMAFSTVEVQSSKGRKEQSPPVLQSSQDTSHTMISHPSGSVPSDRPTEGSCSTRLPSIATLGKGSLGDSLSESSSYPPGTIIATTFVQTIHNGTRIECSQAELFSEMEGSTTTNLSLQPQVSGSPPPTTFSDFTDLHNTTEQYSVHFPPPQNDLAKCPLPLPNGIVMDSTGDQSCTMADIPDAFVESTSNNVHGSHYPQESHISSTAPTMSPNYNSIAHHRNNSAVTFFRSHTSGVSKETSASGSTTLIIEYPHSHDTDLNEYGYTTLTAGEKPSDINSHLVEDQSSGNSSDCQRVGECLHEYRGTATQSRVDGRWRTCTTEPHGTAHENPSWDDQTEHLAKGENHKTSDQNFTTAEIPTDQQRHLFDGVVEPENSTSNRNQILLKVEKHSLEPSNEARSHYFTLQDCESKRASLINVDSNSGDTITTNSQSLQYFTVEGIVNHFRSSGCLGSSSVETDESCLPGHTDKQQSVDIAPPHNFPTSIPAVVDGESALVLVDSGEGHRRPVDNIDDGLNWYIKSSHPGDGSDPSLV